jgi:hypothetical protein
VNFINILSGLFVGIGATMVVLAGWMLVKKLAFVRNSVTASGDVVALVNVWDGIEVSHFPKVLFKTPAGREVTFQSEMGSNPPARRVGEKVRVRYRPEQPQSAEIDTFFSLWGAALLFGLLGGVFTLVGLGIMFGFLLI